MFCSRCHQETGVAYNELCFECYKKYGRARFGKGTGRSDYSGMTGKHAESDSSAITA